MTDKEIIIDGVNVSGCFLYNDKICIRTKSNCNAICDYASYVLRRHLICKKQECETKTLEFEGIKKQLKAENDEIRKKFGIETLINETTGEKTHRSLEVLKLREALQ